MQSRWFSQINWLGFLVNIAGISLFIWFITIWLNIRDETVASSARLDTLTSEVRALEGRVGRLDDQLRNLNSRVRDLRMTVMSAYQSQSNPEGGNQERQDAPSPD